MVLAKRRRTIEQVDCPKDDDEEVDDEDLARRLRGPSNEAIALFEDYSKLPLLTLCLPMIHTGSRDSVCNKRASRCCDPKSAFKTFIPTF